jgi:hypothetical protein
MDDHPFKVGFDADMKLDTSVNNQEMDDFNADINGPSTVDETDLIVPYMDSSCHSHEFIAWQAMKSSGLCSLHST